MRELNEQSKPNGQGFWRGVDCIAFNDEPEITDPEEMRGFPSVHAIAETFNCTTRYVAERVIQRRREFEDKPTTK